MIPLHLCIIDGDSPQQITVSPAVGRNVTYCRFGLHVQYSEPKCTTGWASYGPNSAEFKSIFYKSSTIVRQLPIFDS